MTISIQERQELRKNLLVDLYEFYFDNGGSLYGTTREELTKDKEIDLAYQYLNSKGLIDVERQGSQIFLLRPTSSGIDFVESNLAHKLKSKKTEHHEPNNVANEFMKF